MRSRFILFCCIGMLACGCTQQGPSGLQPGDVCQPEILFAPDGPWTAGTKVSIGMLIKLERTRHGSNYLADADVVLDKVTMNACITFFAGDNMLGEPLEVPFIHDC